MSLVAPLFAVALLAGVATGVRADHDTPGPPPSGAPHAPAPAKGGPPDGRALTFLYGDDHVFAIIPPAGWVVDDTSGLGARIRTVLYPRGQKFATARAFMYVNPIHLDQRAPRTLEQVIDGDVAGFVKHYPKGKVTSAPPTMTDKGRPAEVRLFAKDGGSPDEAVSYVMENGLVMLLVLGSRDTKSFERALPAYRELVKGYTFVAADVKTPTHSR